MAALAVMAYGMAVTPAAAAAPALARLTLPTVSLFFSPMLLNSLPVKLTVLP